MNALMGAGEGLRNRVQADLAAANNAARGSIQTASSFISNNAQLDKIKHGLESATTAVVPNQTAMAMGKLRDFMGTAAAGVTATSAWARLGAVGAAEERLPFEYCLLLKCPEAGIGAKLVGGVKSMVSAARKKSIHHGQKVAARIPLGSKASSTVVPTTSPSPDLEQHHLEAQTSKDSNASSNLSDADEMPPEHFVIVAALHKKGIQAMVVEGVMHHDHQYTMLLLNAPEITIQEQLYRMKVMRWMRTGGLGDMPDKDKMEATTPANRILAIHEIMDTVEYVNPAANPPPTPDTPLTHLMDTDNATVADSYPIHDEAANNFLLEMLSIGKSKGLVAKFKATFLNDETLDAIRNHFGDRTGFYYAYLSFYTKWLCYLAPIGILTIVVFSSIKGDTFDESVANRVLIVYSIALVTWGKLFVSNWKQRSVGLKTRWGLLDLDGHEKRLRTFKPEVDRQGIYTKDRDYYPDWKRYLVIPSGVPFLIVLFICLYCIVLSLFWYEMWLVFSKGWGNCTEVNEELIAQAALDGVAVNPKDMCRSSTVTRNAITATLLEATPGISEAIFFELLLAIFTAIVELICKLQNWRTEEEYNSAFAKQIFAMEFSGVFAWYMILSFFFVPVLWVNEEEEAMFPWDKSPEYSFANGANPDLQPHWYMRCQNEGDSAILGDGSFSCIKEQCPYALRVTMMKAFMMTPFVVNQLINMLVKTGLPKWIHGALKEEKEDNQGTGCWMGLCKLLGCILGHGGMRFKREKCPTLPVVLFEPVLDQPEKGAVKGHHGEMSVEDMETVVGMDMSGDGRVDAIGFDTTGDGLVDTTKELPHRKQSLKSAGMKVMASNNMAHFHGKEVNIEKVIEQSLLWDFKEFNEQLEVTLQFSWIMLFSSVFPLGAMVACLNNILEMRSDTYKMTKVCKRPVPAIANGIGQWENILEGVIKAAVVVNVVIMTISLNAFNVWSSEPRAEGDEGRAGVVDKWREVMLIILGFVVFFDFFLDIVATFVPAEPPNVTKLKKDRFDELFFIFSKPEDTLN